MKPYTNLLFFSLPFLTAALPGGCGGSLEIIHTNSSTIPLMWTCTSINPTSLTDFSGDNTLLASYTTSNASTCADACMPWIPDTLMAAFWYPSDKSCQCWVVGDLGSDATYEENGATWIDFLSTQSDNAPAPAQNWGEFTCPEGCYSGTIAGLEGWCGWISVKPAAPSLGYCAACPAAGQWWIESSGPSCDCYGDLKDLKAWFNYSSNLLVIDKLDFTAPVATSTSTSSTTTKTSSKTSLKTSKTSKSSLKSSLKTLSSVKTTSKSSSKSSLKTLSSVKTTSKSSTKATTSAKPTSTSKLSSNSSTRLNSTSKTSSKSSVSVHKTTSMAK